MLLEKQILLATPPPPSTPARMLCYIFLNLPNCQHPEAIETHTALYKLKQPLPPHNEKLT